jgi:hypothetical protein
LQKHFKNNLEKTEQTCLNQVATQENNHYRIWQPPNTNHQSKKPKKWNHMLIGRGTSTCNKPKKHQLIGTKRE